MLKLDEIREKLKDRNLMEIHRKTGIGYSNLHGIASGLKDNPTYKIIKKLSDYLEQN